MFRYIFPPKDPYNPDPDKRIDCGEPSLMEEISGKQQIAFPIKGYAMLRFELSFRLFRPQLEQYVEEIRPEYPGIEFFVNENKVSMYIEVEDLCSMYPLTQNVTPTSLLHDHAYLHIRMAMAIVDDVYDRILKLHFQRFHEIRSLDNRGNLELSAGESS